ETAALEPSAPPQVREQRDELTEVRGSLDRPGAKAELVRHRVVVNRGVAAVLLVGQHLSRPAQRTADCERSIEAHRDPQTPLYQNISMIKTSACFATPPERDS